MLVSLILLFGVGPKNRRDIITKRIAVVLAVVSVLISISHSAWLTAFIVSIFYLLIYKYPQLRKLVIFVPLILIISSILLLPLSRKFLTSKADYPEEIEKRLVLTERAGRIIAAYPLFGVGLGNFVVRLPEFSVQPAVSWWLQPVHNIFLLIFTEAGVLGLLAFSYLVFKVLKKLLELGSWKLIIPLLIVLLTGTVDHYWVTLQQNQLLLSLLLGISFRKP
jgi:O-antigen ligase